jgi:Zn-dependent protease with chaperone function
MQNMSYLKRVGILWVLTYFLATGYFSQAHAGLFSISEKEEIKAGQQVRQDAYKRYGRPLPANHPMSQRVRALGQRFANLSERKNIPYSYEVLDNNEMLNAFAAPGGPIFVTSKLVKTAANDAELAYVLGHETAHIERKHIVSAVEKQQKVGLGVGILGAILGRGSGGDAIQIAGSVAYTMWSTGYSRDQERDSDVYGVRWMSRLGFDPNASISMLGRLGGGSGGVGRYLATHPDPKSRQENMRKLIAQENLVDVARRVGGPRLMAADLPKYSYSQTSASSSNFDERDFRDAQQAEFNVPLIQVYRNGQSIIMAPLNEFSRWADAAVIFDDADDNVVTVRRRSNSIRLRRGSQQAVINGRTVTLLTTPFVERGEWYVPLDAMAQGVGGQAGWSSDNTRIYLTLDDRRFYTDAPER